MTTMTNNGVTLQQRQYSLTVPHFTRMALVHFWILAYFIPSIDALKHNFVVVQDARTLIAPIGTPYGFLKGGCFSFEIFDYLIELGHRHPRKKKRTSKVDKAKTEDLLKLIDAGFLLKRFPSESAFSKYEETFLMDPKHCIFDSFRTQEHDPVFIDDDFGYDTGEILSAATDGIFLPIFRGGKVKTSSTITYEFKDGEDGLYFLMYQVCSNLTEIRSTFGIDLHYKNKDILGSDSYLTAGDMPLPVIFFYFSISYFGCWLVWVMNIRSINQGKGTILGESLPGQSIMVYPIHHVMSLLLIVKTLTTFLESVRYHFLRITGHAEFWSVLYFAFSFLKGMLLFTTILLIGSGWSFVKPFLTDREKKIIFFVLSLQVLDNIALLILARETKGETKFEDWNAILHLVDIICCCAVFVPIAWQVSTLESKLESDNYKDGRSTSDNLEEIPESPDEISEENARTLSKLKQFQCFYLMVVAYVYTTRIAVYLLATTLDYKHTYVRYVVAEIATLAFYVMTGLRFRPLPENPYTAIPSKKESVEHEIYFDEDRGEVELASMSLTTTKRK